MKVLEVNGKKLAKPITMQYRCHSPEFKVGDLRTLTVYQDLQTSGVNREWGGVIRQQNYGIYRFLRIRNPVLPKVKNIHFILNFYPYSKSKILFTATTYASTRYLITKALGDSKVNDNGQPFLAS